MHCTAVARILTLCSRQERGEVCSCTKPEKLATSTASKLYKSQSACSQTRPTHLRKPFSIMRRMIVCKSSFAMSRSARYRGSLRRRPEATLTSLTAVVSSFADFLPWTIFSRARHWAVTSRLTSSARDRKTLHWTWKKGVFLQWLFFQP